MKIHSGKFIEKQNFIIIWYCDKCVSSTPQKSGKAFWKEIRDVLYIEGRYIAIYVKKKGRSVTFYLERKSFAKQGDVRHSGSLDIKNVHVNYKLYIFL